MTPVLHRLTTIRRLIYDIISPKAEQPTRALKVCGCVCESLDPSITLSEKDEVALDCKICTLNTGYSIPLGHDLRPA